MNDFEITLAAECVIDTILAEEVDLMSVREILEDQREYWGYFDASDGEHHELPEETDDEAVAIKLRVREILEGLRDRVEYVSRDS